MGPECGSTSVTRTGVTPASKRGPVGELCKHSYLKLKIIVQSKYPYFTREEKKGGGRKREKDRGQRGGRALSIQGGRLATISVSGAALHPQQGHHLSLHQMVFLLPPSLHCLPPCRGCVGDLGALLSGFSNHHACLSSYFHKTVSCFTGWP